MTDATDPIVKPGWKTTEFWLNLATMVVGAIMALGLPAESKIMKAAGLAAMLLAATGHTVSRTFVKASVILIACLALAGCGGLASKTAKDIETASFMILPEYIVYVNADTKLTEDQKQDRRNQVRALQDVIRNAQK